MNQIYLYTANKAKEQQIHSLCKSLRIGFHIIVPTDLNRTVAEITGGVMLGGRIPGVSPGLRASDTATGTKAPLFYQMPEFLLFDRMEDALLDRFLAEYKQAAISAIPYKAVVTLTNRRWSLYDLIEAIREEHDVTHK